MASLSRYFIAALVGPLACAELLQPRATQPVRATASDIGYFTDPTYNRDSCVSTKVGARELWTCRDSVAYDGQPFVFLTSTASWTTFVNGKPNIVNDNLTSSSSSSGEPYFPMAKDECPPDGNCGNGSERWLIWPDQAPLPVGVSGSTYLYTWVPRAHINAQGVLDTGDYPATSLYRGVFDGNDQSSDLPPTTLLQEYFWQNNTIAYGSYGWVIGASDGNAYLYGQGAYGAVALAKVAPSSIEDQTKYQYYDYKSGSWSATMPSIDDSSAYIPNAGNGNGGTFYYSSHFDLYIWIGGQSANNPTFMITTAPNPWGPWETPTVLYDNGISATANNGYSWAAHPGLSADGGNGQDIYLTYTRQNHYYETVLIYLTWQ